MFAPKEGQEVASVSDDHTCRYVFCSRHHWNSSIGFLCMYLHSWLIFLLHAFYTHLIFIEPSFWRGKLVLLTTLWGFLFDFLCFSFFFTCLFSKQYFELNRWMRRKLFYLGIMEKIILRIIEKHLKDNAVIEHSQHGFTRGSILFNFVTKLST